MSGRAAFAPTLAPFLDALAAGTPTPGGGSVAALCAALACALAGMVARLTLARERFRVVHPEMEAVAREADELRAELLRLVDDDAAAFEAVMAAYRLPKGTAAEEAAGRASVEAALAGAAPVPLRTAAGAVRAARLAAAVAARGNPSARSDATIAADLAGSAWRAAAANVRANVDAMAGSERADAIRAELDRLEAEAAALWPGC